MVRVGKKSEIFGESGEGKKSEIFGESGEGKKSEIFDGPGWAKNLKFLMVWGGQKI
jgi:hypothetical protein